MEVYNTTIIPIKHIGNWDKGKRRITKWEILKKVH